MSRHKPSPECLDWGPTQGGGVKGPHAGKGDHECEGAPTEMRGPRGELQAWWWSKNFSQALPLSK